MRPEQPKIEAAGQTACYVKDGVLSQWNFVVIGSVRELDGVLIEITIFLLFLT